MRNSALLLAHRLSLLIALCMSTALLIDYLQPLPAFCELGSACDRVRRSSFGRLGGIPVPVFGVAGFGLIFVLGLSEDPRAQRLRRALTSAAALGAVTLLVLQAFVIQAFCRLCVTVDAMALIAAVTSASMATASASPRRGTSPFLWPSCAVGVVLLPILFSHWGPPPTPIPKVISARWAEGKINVIEFSDFECPFCRQLHPVLASAMARYTDQLQAQRLNMPLGGHPHARDAARAYCCADAQGKGEAMADRLFVADDLSEGGCRTLATSLGVSISAFDACVAHEADTRIDREIAVVKEAGLVGLPTVWIEGERLVGLQSSESITAALGRASRGVRPWGIPRMYLWVAVALLLGWTTSRQLRVDLHTE